MAATFTPQTFRAKVAELFQNIHTFYHHAGVSPLDEEHITVQLSLKLSEWARSLAPAITISPWYTVTGENKAAWKANVPTIAANLAFNTIFSSKGIEDELGFDVAWDCKFGTNQRYIYYLQAKCFKGIRDGVDFTYPDGKGGQYDALNTLINTRPRPADAVNVGGGYLIYADVRGGPRITYAPINEIAALRAAMPNISINKALGLYFLRDQYLFTSGTPRIFVNPPPALAIDAALTTAIAAIDANPATAHAALPNTGPPPALATIAGTFDGAWLRATIDSLYGDINQLYQDAQTPGSVVVFEEHITLQLNLELSRAVKVRLNNAALATWSDPKDAGFYEDLKPTKPLSNIPQVAAAQIAQGAKVATTLRRSKSITQDELDDTVIFRAYFPSKGLESQLGYDFAWHAKFFGIDGKRNANYTYYIQAKKVGDKKSVNFSYDGNKQLAAISDNTAFAIAANTGPALIDAAYIVYSGTKLFYVPVKSAVDGGTLLETRSKLSSTAAVDQALGVWFDSLPDAASAKPFVAPFPPLLQDPALVNAAIDTCGGAAPPAVDRPRRTSNPAPGPRRIWKDIQDSAVLILAPSNVARSAAAATKSAAAAAAEALAAAQVVTDSKTAGKAAPIIVLVAQAAAEADAAAKTAATASADAQAALVAVATATTGADVAAAVRAVEEAANAVQRTASAAASAQAAKEKAITTSTGKRPLDTPVDKSGKK